MALANRLRLLAAGVALLAVLLAATPAAAVMNGQADGMAHRNVGMVGAVLPGNRVVPVCSGFLVSRTVALTAAHCVKAILDLGTSTAIISFSPDLRVTLSPLRIGTVVMDPGYDGDGFDKHDFGAIRWTSPVASMPPVSLPGLGLLDEMRVDGLLHHQSFLAVGYGAVDRVHQNDEGADATDDDSQGPWDFYADLKRNRAMSSYNALTRAALKLSTNAVHDDGGACHGDSGGPMFLGSNGPAVALVVTGDHICRATATALRLDTPAARGFISSLGVTLP